MKKMYRITFDTKKNGFKSLAIDVEANNLKEAKAIAIERWNFHQRNTHMFHVEVRRLQDTEEFLYHWFVRVEE